MTDYLVWFFSTADGSQLLIPTLRIFAILTVLYQWDSVFLILRFFFLKAFGIRKFTGLEPENRLSALVVLPTMLRNHAEMEGIKRAASSVALNRYPGELYIVCSIDNRNASPELYKDFELWTRLYCAPKNVHVYVTSSGRRQGKAMAIERAVQHMQQLVDNDIAKDFPKVFFNMDADSELAPQTLERMVFKITRRSRLTGKRPMIVASNVKLSKSHYWHNWKSLFTVRGFLSLSVANEYMTSISVAKHNSKLFPVIVASGALYCTWSEFPRMSARYAAFMQTLRLKDFVAWLFGKAPPKFSASSVQPLPESQTGEGDDAWMTWFASGAVWKGEGISVDFPRSPLHAFGRMLCYWFIRPLVYDAKAQIYTSSPTKVKTLFKQRIRWNGSRIWGIQRWRKAFLYSWGIGSAVYANSLVTIVVHAMVLVSLILFPFITADMSFLPLTIMANATYIFIRTQSLLIAFLYDEDLLGQWHKMLVLPFMPLYHFIFNIIPTVVAMVKDVFLFGSNTHFAPEQTLIRGQTSRIALAFRIRRFLRMTYRSVMHGDVEFGWFWLGWRETAYTANGYAGWDKKPTTVKQSPNAGKESLDLKPVIVSRRI